MKLASVAALLSCTPSPTACASSLLAVRGRSRSQSHSLTRHTAQKLFGDTECPCIGFDGIEGETSVTLDGGKEVAFPADLGARCEKWDDNTHPDCLGKDKPDWCGQPWCFVDACNCGIPVLPKTSSYAADTRYRGKPIFYSYATCGGKDTWTKVLPEVGTTGCRCIGFDNVPGSTEVRINGEKVKFPAEIGGTCQAWDDGRHPDCKGDKPPSWCKANWCYVDPCSCSLPEQPKVTMYLPDATFTGKSLYYSYETCGSNDTFTAEHNTEACVNQKSEKKCNSMRRSDGADKCSWTHGACLGAELVDHPLCDGVVKQQERASKSAAAPGAGRLAAAALTAAAVAAATVGL